MTSIVGTVWVW